MTLWRVSNHAVLDGAGGLRASGRWHWRGTPIVYSAGSPAGALLETLVHAEIDQEDIPAAFRFLEIDVDDSVAVETIRLRDLTAGWRKDMRQTRRIGDEWLRSQRTAMLRVPSVVAPETWNYLLNPVHPQSSQARIVKIRRHRADRRLFR